MEVTQGVLSLVDTVWSAAMYFLLLSTFSSFIMPEQHIFALLHQEQNKDEFLCRKTKNTPQPILCNVTTRACMDTDVWLNWVFMQGSFLISFCVFGAWK